MIDLSPLISGPSSNSSIKIGVTANSGLHTNELICGVAFALADELACSSRSARNISFVWKNDGRNADRAIEVAQEYEQEAVRYVIGHLSASTSIPASEIYSKKKILFFATGTTHPALCKEDKECILRLCPVDTDQAKLIVSLLEEHFKNFTVHIIIQNIEYGYSLSRLVRKFGSGKNIICHLINENRSGDQIKSISLESEHQVVIVCAIHEYAAKYINELVSSGYSGAFIVGDDCDIPNFYRLLNYPKLEIFVPKISFSPEINKNFNFPSLNKKYFELQNELPGAYFFTSYAACRILINSLDSSKCLHPSTIYRSLLSHEIKSQLWAPFSFDKSGNNKELYWDMFCAKDTNFEQG